MDLIFNQLNLNNKPTINDNFNQDDNTILSDEKNINIDVNDLNNTEIKTKNKKKSTEYVNKFITKNKDKLKEKIICNICLSTYTYFNKYTHQKTKRHQTFLNKNKNHIKLDL